MALAVLGEMLTRYEKDYEASLHDWEVGIALAVLREARDRVAAAEAAL